jgi:hypothetical protein
MNHDQFSARMKSAITAKSDRPALDVATDLRLLLQELEPAARAGINDWHKQQVLSLLVEVLDESEDECHEAWLALTQFTEETSRYWDRALSSTRRDFDRWKSR